MSLPPPQLLPGRHSLVRGLGFWQATAINITMIVGVGIFVTIPDILGHLPGPYALLAWLAAGVLIIFDSMIWGELAAAMPSAGGSYYMLLESYGRWRWGRLMAFLFVWQFLISGPLELATGLVASGQFSTFFSEEFKEFDERYTWSASATLLKEKIEVAVGPSRLVGFLMGAVVMFLLYRNVATLGRLSIVFLLGVLAVVGWVIIDGALHFDRASAFDVKESELPTSPVQALGAAMALAVYSYLGYYTVCYLGDEIRDPARTIPRSILASAAAAVLLFTLMHLAFVGVVPWRDAALSKNLAAAFMEKIHGQWAAIVATVLLIGSSFASTFSGMFGYSRVPYAAARNRHFLRWFEDVHPEHQIPHRSLLLIGAMTLFWSFFSLEMVIQALIATRILGQFVAQVFGVILLRNLQPDRPRPWRMWLYPLPCAVALAGWLFVYATTKPLFIVVGAVTLLAGVVAFLAWARRDGGWPFRRQET